MASIIHLQLDGDGAFQDLRGKMMGVHHLTGDFTIAALTAGMVSGRPSLCLRFDLPGGPVVIQETSVKGLLAAAHATRPSAPSRTRFRMRRFTGMSIIPGEATMRTRLSRARSISLSASSTVVVMVLLKCACLPASTAIMPCSKWKPIGEPIVRMSTSASVRSSSYVR